MDIIPDAPVRIWGIPFEGFNVATLLNTWIVMALILVGAVLAVRSLKPVPGRWQALVEMIAEFFESICNSTLGEAHGRKYLPFVATLFLFVFLSNVIGSLPNFLEAFGWPGFYCPTQDLNTPLGLALLVLIVVHASAIRVKGFGGWLWSFYEPSFPAGGTAMKAVGLALLAGGAVLTGHVAGAYVRAFPGSGGTERAALGLLVALLVVNTLVVAVTAVRCKRIPNVLMAPLNVVGELGKAISHPFRLFGNIFGGFVIMTVISHLIYQIGLPALLTGFFGLFIGLVQAFVFAMLALAYTAVQIAD
jgi:F0F1-type ATP synthase membrane subunit a